MRKKTYEVYTDDGYKHNHWCTEERMYEISSFKNVVMIKEFHYTPSGKRIEKTVYVK